jgi:hypothetical protein
MRRTRWICLLVCAALLASGCQAARAGTRCRGDIWGHEGDYVLRCVGGRWVRHATKAQVAALIKAIIDARGPGPGEVVRPASLGSVTFPNTADPDVLVHGGVHYVFSTRTYHRVPVRIAPNVDATFTDGPGKTLEAMPTPVPWASRDEVWAPTVRRVGNRFVMFFGSFRKNPPDPANDTCIGRAFASSPTGPYVPDPAPFSCGFDGVRGALDPSLYIGPDGSLTLLAAFGGSQMNIRAYRLDANTNIVSGPHDLLARQHPWEVWFLENPSMHFDGRHYVLAYSAGRWQTAGYTTGIARCTTPTGPCSSSPAGPWLSSIGDRVGPGGLSFFTGADGQTRVIYHTYPASSVCGTCRASHVRRVVFDPWPRLL